jgi:hypothetical protein
MQEKGFVRAGQGHNESRCCPCPNPTHPLRVEVGQISLGAYAQFSRQWLMTSFTEFWLPEAQKRLLSGHCRPLIRGPQTSVLGRWVTMDSM